MRRCDESSLQFPVFAAGEIPSVRMFRPEPGPLQGHPSARESGFNVPLLLAQQP